MILGTLVPPAPPPVSSDISDTESESDSDVESIEVKPAKGKGKAREPELEPEPKPYGWVYVGSHNFMPSAWGTLSGRGFNPVINVRYALIFGVFRSSCSISNILSLTYLTHR
jgi:tyrosyl-DNA phosphodiesterase-1